MLKYLSIWLIYIANYLYNIYTKIKIFYVFNFHPLASHRQKNLCRLFPNYKQFATKGVVRCKNLKGIGSHHFVRQ